jgi:hypothetical protein
MTSINTDQQAFVWIWLPGAIDPVSLPESWKPQTGVMCCLIRVKAILRGSNLEKEVRHVLIAKAPATQPVKTPTPQKQRHWGKHGKY